MEPETNVGEAFWRALEGGDEEARWALIRALSRDFDAVLEAVRGRVRAGVVAPDTVAAVRAVEAVVAALALSGRVRLLLPREPVAGWGPLRELGELLVGLGAGEVYWVRMLPGGRLAAMDAVRGVARVLRGAGARVLDVTDAPPTVVAAAPGGGVRWLTVLVKKGSMAVFDRFWFVR